jgi:holo-[acyl-carrier protein] synthase
MAEMPTAPLTSSRVGIDLVQISRIEASLQRFGDRFLRRLFHADEIAYALQAPALSAQRLAARFAAKEAALKALRIADKGIAWHEIEVRRADDGDCTLLLHGAADAAAREAGMSIASLSLTHEGDYAGAVVLVQPHSLSNTSHATS